MAISIIITYRKIKMAELSWADYECHWKKTKYASTQWAFVLLPLLWREGFWHVYNICVTSVYAQTRTWKSLHIRQLPNPAHTCMFMGNYIFIFFLEYFIEKNMGYPELLSCCNKRKNVKIGAMRAHQNADSPSSLSSFCVQTMLILIWKRSIDVFQVRMGMSKSHGCYHLHTCFQFIYEEEGRDFYL